MSIEELITGHTAAVKENTAAVHALIKALGEAEANRTAVVEAATSAIATANAPKTRKKAEEKTEVLSTDAEIAEVAKARAERAAPPPPPAVEVVSLDDAKAVLGGFIRDCKVPADEAGRKAKAKELMAQANGGTEVGLLGLTDEGRTKFVSLLKAHIEAAAQQSSSDDDLM